MPRTKTPSTPKTPPMDLQGFVAALNANEAEALVAMHEQLKRRKVRLFTTGAIVGAVLGFFCTGLFYLLGLALAVPPENQAGLLNLVLWATPGFSFTYALLAKDGLRLEPQSLWPKPLAEEGGCLKLERLVSENPDLSLLPPLESNRQLYCADYLLAQEKVQAIRSSETQEREACARLHSRAVAVAN